MEPVARKKCDVSTDRVTDEQSALADLPTTGRGSQRDSGERVRSDSAGGRDLPNVELDRAWPLIAAAGEHAPCGHWPILRKRGRGDTVASLRFVLAEESKLLLTRTGRSSASTKSVGRDLPTGSAVGHTHTSITIKRKQDKQVAMVRGR